MTHDTKKTKKLRLKKLFRPTTPPVKEEVTEVPTERFIVVKELPVQQVREVKKDD